MLGLAGLAGVLVGMLLLEACADDTPTAPGGPDPGGQAGVGVNANGTRIVIAPHWVTLDTVGVTGTFSATVIDPEGDTVEAAVTWGSADTAIATVDTVGVVTAVAFGKTQVTATYDSATAEATVEVALPLTDREILEILYEATGGRRLDRQHELAERRGFWRVVWGGCVPGEGGAYFSSGEQPGRHNPAGTRGTGRDVRPLPGR